MRKAGRAIGRFLGAGLAGSAKAGATGLGVYFVQKAATQRIEALQKHPMVGPIALGVGGHILKKKFPTVGTAMVGAGFYAGALAYDLNRMSTAGQGGAQGGAGTNALIEPDDIRALVSPSEIRGIDVNQDAPSLDTRAALEL